MATFRIRALLEALSPDPLREHCPLTEDLRQATDALMAARSEEGRERALADWLTKHQPCIFGRLAAQRGLVTYCFLTEDDLSRSDDEISEQIQARRQAWKAQAEDGRRSAFIILGVSERLALASPDEHLRDLAVELAQQYLRRALEPDRIYHDQLRLWDLSFAGRRRWRVGVNFFGAQGDQRWWHDHRIPGGIGFSMNSVGHLVASEARRRAIQEAAGPRAAQGSASRLARLRQAEAEVAKLQETSLTSLDHALKLAMYTIRGASEKRESDCCRWERATLLLRAEPAIACPVAHIRADPALSQYSTDTYLGWYHTDVTVPAEYFSPSQDRPRAIREPFSLDFTYLHAGVGKDYRELARGVRSGIGSGRSRRKK